MKSRTVWFDDFSVSLSHYDVTVILGKEVLILYMQYCCIHSKNQIYLMSNVHGY